MECLSTTARERKDDVNSYRSDGAAVTCPSCGANFGGMRHCPWDGAKLIPLEDADPAAIAFYTALEQEELGGR